jgi:hypothetical protein
MAKHNNAIKTPLVGFVYCNIRLNNHRMLLFFIFLELFRYWIFMFFNKKNIKDFHYYEGLFM